MGIGERIKNLRAQKDITQIELARKLNVSSGNVGEWEQGKAKPGADALVSLASVFGISIDWLLTGVEKDGVCFSNTEIDIVRKLRELPESDLEDIKVLLELKHQRKLKEELTL